MAIVGVVAMTDDENARSLARAAMWIRLARSLPVADPETEASIDRIIAEKVGPSRPLPVTRSGTLPRARVVVD